MNFCRGLLLFATIKEEACYLRHVGGMRCCLMNCKNDYAHHAQGDCSYDHRGEDVKLSVLGVAVVMTLGFSLVELFTGWVANSLALIGDAGHMATDSASLLFALVANIIARKGVDSDHSFGHGRVEVLAAFLNGLVMLGVVGWIFLEAYERLEAPTKVDGGPVMLVAFIGLCINIVVAWSLSRDKKNVNTRAALLHVMGDLLGSVAAIVAGALIYFFGDGFSIADPLLSFLVGFLVLHSTYEVLKDSSAVLLDSVPEGVDYYKVGDALSRIPGVSRVHDLHVWTIAPGHGAVMAHLCVQTGIDWERVLSDAQKMLLSEFGLEHITLQPEWNNQEQDSECTLPNSADGCGCSSAQCKRLAQ